MFSRPKGLPIATAICPTLTSLLSSKLHRYQQARRHIDLDDCQVGVGIGAKYLGRSLGAVGKDHEDLARVFNHMVVREDVSFFVPNEARTFALDEAIGGAGKLLGIGWQTGDAVNRRCASG